VLALWGVVALVAAVLVVVLLHDRKGGPRADVSSYIRQVNATSTAFSKNYRTVEKAYSSFALAPQKAAAQEPQLRTAAADLTRLRAGIERVPAPKAAATLRLRLIAFFRQQEAVARELLGVSVYLPRLDAAERGLAPAGARMRVALKAGGKPSEQADALDAYASALDGAAGAVAALEPPQLFRATQALQLQRLRRAARLVRRLAHALSANDRPALEAAGKALGKPAAASDAARTAILSYNKRVEKIHRLAAEVVLERRRLDEQLG
jgi:hypothetical protein